MIKPNNILQAFTSTFSGNTPPLNHGLNLLGREPKANGPEDAAQLSGDAQKPEQRNLKMEAQLQVMMLSMMTPEEQDAHMEGLEKNDPELAKAIMEALEGPSSEHGPEHSAPAQHAEPAEHEAAAPVEAASAPEAAEAAGESLGPEVKLPGVPEGFLWKPKSEANGNLVMLLPKGMQAKSIEIVSPDGKKTLSSVNRGGEQGKIANGGREHYRFGKPGSGYPPNSKVRIKGTDGKTTEIKIPKPSIRNAGGGGKKKT